jgi:phosphoribosyl-ATP pyrophosphohydrolase/phosphoribosyl-AMP cyclohydrolase
MIDVNELDWDKGEGLLPTVIQDADNLRVLMLGYMNREALTQTLETGRTTFFSRSKQRLWVKGETSGNFLDFVSAQMDCDKDTILIKAKPQGPVCHTGTQTCFGDGEENPILFLHELSQIIQRRNQERPKDSYTTKLFDEGASRIAQKVGEEGVELSLAHMKGDKEEILNESADLLFHMMILLEDAGLDMADVCEVLTRRKLTSE